MEKQQEQQQQLNSAARTKNPRPSPAGLQCLLLNIFLQDLLLNCQTNKIKLKDPRDS